MSQKNIALVVKKLNNNRSNERGILSGCMKCVCDRNAPSIGMTYYDKNC